MNFTSFLRCSKVVVGKCKFCIPLVFDIRSSDDSVTSEETRHIGRISEVTNLLIGFVSIEMGDHLWAGKPPQYFIKPPTPPRPAQSQPNAMDTVCQICQSLRNCVYQLTNSYLVERYDCQIMFCMPSYDCQIMFCMPSYHHHPQHQSSTVSDTAHTHSSCLNTSHTYRTAISSHGRCTQTLIRPLYMSC